MLSGTLCLSYSDAYGLILDLKDRDEAGQSDTLFLLKHVMRVFIIQREQ